MSTTTAVPSSTSASLPFPAHAALFQPVRLGALELAHRVVMAPLTRLRSAQPGNIPHALNATYYGQRATPGGLLIAEATQVVPEGQGYPQSPGIHNVAQRDGWKLVTEAVHARGGAIVLQLWHVGRISHSSMQPGGKLPVSASARRPEGLTYTATFEQVPFETPRALETEEIPELVRAYAAAATLAKEAGFDGVEIHNANGYLLDQFLRDGTNHRTDRYGGPVANRLRFPLEVVEAVTAVWGGDRVGIRLSPFGQFNDMRDTDPVGLFSAYLRELNRFGLAYVHLIEARQDTPDNADHPEFRRPVGEVFRPATNAPILAAGGYTGATGAAAIVQGDAEAIAFGRHFISNPDLVERLRRGAALHPYDRSTFYGGAEKGYTDYPFLAE